MTRVSNTGEFTGFLLGIGLGQAMEKVLAIDCFDPLRMALECPFKSH